MLRSHPYIMKFGEKLVDLCGVAQYAIAIKGKRSSNSSCLSTTILIDNHFNEGSNIPLTVPINLGSKRGGEGLMNS